MVAHSVKFRLLGTAVVSIALLMLAVTPVWAQCRPLQAVRPSDCPPPPCPVPKVQEPALTPPGKEVTPTTPEQRRPVEPSPLAEAGLAPERALALGGETFAAAPGMKGDAVPIPSIAFAPPQGSASQPRTALIVPSARSFKISDDESPRPRDRVFFDFNYYDNVGAAVSQRLGIDLRDIAIYRETFGLEKTFLDNTASIGLRLPLNTLSAESTTFGLGGTDTDVGDLTVVAKYAFWQNPQTGSLLSAGLAVTAPTGPNHFAGSAIRTVHDTILQPFLGYIWAGDRWFVHGFTSMDVPTDGRDVTALSNSVGVGYIFARADPEARLLKAVVPTFEVHVTDPLNHRGAFTINDPAGTADVVDLTMAATFELVRRSNLSVGIVAPVTGPKPFDVEALVQLNWFFGARGRGSSANVIGD
jgi:Putative MetA-pathway of phenol degradation